MPVEFKAPRWSKQPKLVLYPGEYEGDGRTYVDPSTDKRYPSVTSVLKNTPKADLMGWAALKVAERARDRTDIVMGDPDKVVDRLRYAYKDYRDERGWVGSAVHATIQAEHEGTWDFPELDAEMQAMLDNFQQFSEAWNLRIFRSETTILNERYGVMGTLDALAEVTDPLTGEVRKGIIDWKTSRKLLPEHEMQIAALKSATHAFTEVAEGTPGAHLRKGKTKAENSWWLKEEVDWSDTMFAGLVHLRADSWDFEEVPIERLELREKQFGVYAQLNSINRSIREKGWSDL